MPISSSMAWSVSMKGSAKRRATCRPAEDLPEPGMPMRMITTFASQCMKIDGQGESAF